MKNEYIGASKMINSLADFKRALTVGSVWEATYLGEGIREVLGIRPVVIKQSNSVAFKTPNGASWLEFGKAKNYSFNSGSVFVKDEITGDLILEYRPVNNQGSN